MMMLTEGLLSQMVLQITGSYKVKHHPQGKGEGLPEYELDFTPPFARMPMISSLEKVKRPKLSKPTATLLMISPLEEVELSSNVITSS